MKALNRSSRKKNHKKQNIIQGDIVKNEEENEQKLV